jgi:hypothetical protein
MHGSAGCPACMAPVFVEVTEISPPDYSHIVREGAEGGAMVSEEPTQCKNGGHILNMSSTASKKRMNAMLCEMLWNGIIHALLAPCPPSLLVSLTPTSIPSPPSVRCPLPPLIIDSLGGLLCSSLLVDQRAAHRQCTSSSMAIVICFQSEPLQAPTRTHVSLPAKTLTTRFP